MRSTRSWAGHRRRSGDRGRPYRGATPSAGELGHVPVSGGGAGCYCGKRGCLEQEAGLPALVRRARLGRDRRLPGELVSDPALARAAAGGRVVRACGGRRARRAGRLPRVRGRRSDACTRGQLGLFTRAVEERCFRRCGARWRSRSRRYWRTWESSAGWLWCTTRRRCWRTTGDARAQARGARRDRGPEHVGRPGTTLIPPNGEKTRSLRTPAQAEQAQRKPVWPAELSGTLEVRAATR
ncbi:ROK family protein [Streptomyces sp. NPDC052043]|uniref:ROK family protein n=1 Tax=Streptomyces sp. NPDC052043 TaxID=3365684 RepID=UPI0037CDDA68